MSPHAAAIPSRCLYLGTLPLSQHFAAVSALCRCLSTLPLSQHSASLSTLPLSPLCLPPLPPSALCLPQRSVSLSALPPSGPCARRQRQSFRALKPFLAVAAGTAAKSALALKYAKSALRALLRPLKTQCSAAAAAFFRVLHAGFFRLRWMRPFAIWLKKS